MEVQLTYGRDETGRMRHIMDVPNGLACGCTCPECGAPLVAKNQGANIHPHFAHASGTACNGAHESELHLLAKEILAEEKAVMLPAYGSVYEGGIMRFAAMEVEERHDYSMLQPDVVGLQQNPRTGKTSRLWIEIRVTHEVGAEKYGKIKELGVSCIEIDLSMYKEMEVGRERLCDFLLHDGSHRQWINNPKLEARQEEMARQRRAYAEKMASLEQQKQADNPSLTRKEIQRVTEEKVVRRDKCDKCRFHSTRLAILQEMKHYKLPAELRDLILRHPLKWFNTSSLLSPLPTRQTDYLLTIGNDTIMLSTDSPDIYGQEVSQARIVQNKRAIHFFGQILPNLIKTIGIKCSQTGRFLPAEDGKMYIICKKKD